MAPSIVIPAATRRTPHSAQPDARKGSPPPAAENCSHFSATTTRVQRHLQPGLAATERVSSSRRLLPCQSHPRGTYRTPAEDCAAGVSRLEPRLPFLLDAGRWLAQCQALLKVTSHDQEQTLCSASVSIFACQPSPALGFPLFSVPFRFTSRFSIHGQLRRQDQPLPIKCLAGGPFRRWRPQPSRKTAQSGRRLGLLFVCALLE